MLHLATLGGLALEGDCGPLGGAALRPRPLALLALVACAGLRGITRDKVMAYIWPDSDAGHARNCLKQTLFVLRRDLHRDPFLNNPAMLWLDPQVISVDCREFLQAVEQRAFRTAVELYRGPFLEGFHLGGGHAEFERWIEEERARLAHRYELSLQALATSAEAANDPALAVEWWQRLAEHDPFSSRNALGLMKALVAIGNRAGALRYAERHRRLLREELNAEPDTGERAFVKLLLERKT
jgi:DNA-binding SARP family transcriptional activator